MRSRRRWLAVPAAPLLALAGGCALFGSGALFGGESTMAVTVAPDLNRDFPVAVEVVYTYTKPLAEQLRAKTARQWFDGREQFARDNPPTDWQSRRWEWVPGQAVAPQTLDYRVGARPPIVFVGYTGPGEHRQQVEIGRDFSLALGRDDFTIHPLTR